jgi:hypothetical protein
VDEYVVHVAGSIARATRSWTVGRRSKLWLRRILVKLLEICLDNTFVLLSQIHALGGLMEARVGRLDSALSTVYEA